MGIDLQTLFILYAVLNIVTIFIFILFLLSIKEKGDALIIYIISSFIITVEWFVTGAMSGATSPFFELLTNFIVFIWIVYSFYALIIANGKFNKREFIGANSIAIGATIIYAFFCAKPEHIQIIVTAILMGILYLIGSFMLVKRTKYSSLQGYVGWLAALMSLIYFYRIYYVVKIDSTITTFDPIPVNIITYLFFFIESFSVGIIILMLHYEKSKRKIEMHNEELIELSDTKSKILSVIAHDLKNHFNSILGLSEFISKVDANIPVGRERKKVGLINSTAKSAYVLLTNLLDWANAKNDRIKFEPSLLRINEVVNAVVNICKPEADIKEIELDVIFEDNLYVHADRNMLRTILRNLLLNAVKYSYRNNKIQILIQQNKSMVKISVIDHGIGMSNEEINNLLHRSNSISKYGTEKEKGSGLGLQICKEYLKKHKSQLMITSQPQFGSTFYFELPLIKSN